MAGTKAGGVKARDTNFKKYGKNFYKEIGRRGGKNGHTGGFYNNPEFAKIVGAIGGRRSRRGSKYVYTMVASKDVTPSQLEGSAPALAKILDCSVSAIQTSYTRGREFKGYKITRRLAE